MPKKGEPEQVDISRFKSEEDALRQVEAVRDRLHQLAKLVFESNDRNITYLSMFLLSAIARANGLHLATVHSIETSNPHAAIPLIRSYGDLVVTALYVRDHPEYVDALTDRRRDTKSKRRSIGSLITAVTKYAPGIKHVYDELSEGTHFGSVAMWASWTHKPDTDGTVTYASYPRWRDAQRDPLVIAGWLIELGEALIGTVETTVGAYLSQAPAART
jgi:hypothetical protein